MNSNGRIAEMAACEYLKKKRYKLLEYNYTTRFGEIDLIMKNRKYICFIEVKMRSRGAIASPMEFVDYRKQNRIIAAAKIYLSNNSCNLQPRFDVVEVFCENSNIKSVKHLENAFELY